MCLQSCFAELNHPCTKWFLTWPRDRESLLLSRTIFYVPNYVNWLFTHYLSCVDILEISKQNKRTVESVTTYLYLIILVKTIYSLSSYFNTFVYFIYSALWTNIVCTQRIWTKSYFDKRIDGFRQQHYCLCKHRKAHHHQLPKVWSLPPTRNTVWNNWGI